jgi:hypothetical protein
MGQSVLLLFAIVGLIVGSESDFFSTAVARPYLDHVLHEGMMCSLEKPKRSDCTARAKTKIKRVLTWGRIEKLHISVREQVNRRQVSSGELYWCPNDRGSICKNKIRLTETIKEIRFLDSSP